MASQQPTPAPSGMLGIIEKGAGFASKLTSGIGLATEEMPLAGTLLSTLVEMLQKLHGHAHPPSGAQ